MKDGAPAPAKAVPPVPVKLLAIGITIKIYVSVADAVAVMFNVPDTVTTLPTRIYCAVRYVTEPTLDVPPAPVVGGYVPE